MSDEPKRIVWMMDETRVEASPEDWGRLDSLFRQMICVCGNDSFTHEIVEPNACIEDVAAKCQRKP